MLVYLRNADLVAPEPMGLVDILVAGERIAAIQSVTPNHPVTIPTQWPCEVHDLAGATVIPGLVDSHVHLTGGGGESGPETKVPPLQLTQLTSAGVTTVVGLLGTDSVTRGPRELLAATRAMQRLGLTAYMWTGAYPVPTPTITGTVRGDVTLVEQVIGAGEVAISDHRSSQPTYDEIVRLAAECHVGGLLAKKAGVLHLHLGDGKRGLAFVARALEESELPARVLQPTHCNRNHTLWAEAMTLGAKGVPIDVTAFPPDDDETGLSAADAVTQWLDAGLPAERLTVSSDGGGCIPLFDADGVMQRMDVGSSSTLLAMVRDLVGRGRALSEVVPFVTSNVAKQLRLSQKGELAPGRDADLVVLTAQMKVSAVMARGRWMVRDGESVVRGPFE
ncbi:MAG: beta-aspartyl-peptidase [Myxococcales bacterium]|nr:beta-aspartyl-peptidase [Myxococcales bacterium]